VQGVFSGSIPRGDLSRGLRSLLKGDAEKMYLEGMVESGVFDDAGEAKDELENEDEDTIFAWLEAQNGYISEFAKAVADTLAIEDTAQRKQAQDAIRARVDYWRNSLEGLGRLGKMSALKNEVGIWELGDTEEHCDNESGKYGCQQLNGQAHRMSWYTQRNLNPGTPGSETTCGGYNCQCVLRSKRTGKVIAG